MANLLFLVGLVLCAAHADAACSYPADLAGSWESTKGTVLTFDGSWMTGFVLQTFDQVFDTWECYIRDGNRTISKAKGIIDVYDILFEAFVCMEFTKVNDNVQYFYQHSNIEVSAENERVVVFKYDTKVPSASEVCNRHVGVAEYHVIVKQGSTPASLSPCPSDLLGYFGYTYNDGNGDKCGPWWSLLDTCTSSRDMIFDYSKCRHLQAYSQTGVVGCVLDLNTGNTTYLTVYNFDSSVNGDTTHRFTCYAFERDGPVLRVSQRPMVCDEGQSASTLPPGGALLELSMYGTCGDGMPVISTVPTTPTTPPTTTSVSIPTPGSACGPVCMLYCPYGNVEDDRGCPLCKCQEAPNDESGNGAAIAVAVVICLLLMGLLIFVGVIVYRHRKKKRLQSKVLQSSEEKTGYDNEAQVKDDERQMGIKTPESQLGEETLVDETGKELSEVELQRLLMGRAWDYLYRKTGTGEHEQVVQRARSLASIHALVPTGSRVTLRSNEAEELLSPKDTAPQNKRTSEERAQLPNSILTPRFPKGAAPVMTAWKPERLHTDRNDVLPRDTGEGSRLLSSDSSQNSSPRIFTERSTKSSPKTRSDGDISDRNQEAWTAKQNDREQLKSPTSSIESDPNEIQENAKVHRTGRHHADAHGGARAKERDGHRHTRSGEASNREHKTGTTGHTHRTRSEKKDHSRSNKGHSRQSNATRDNSSSRRERQRSHERKSRENKSNREHQHGTETTTGSNTSNHVTDIYDEDKQIVSETVSTFQKPEQLVELLGAASMPTTDITSSPPGSDRQHENGLSFAENSYTTKRETANDGKVLMLQDNASANGQESNNATFV